MSRYLILALEQAQLSVCKQKHGAVLVRGGCVLMVGHNKPRNQHLNQPKASVHAEVAVVRGCKNGYGAKLYVVRLGKDGLAKGSKPCKDCARVLVAKGIRKVVHS